MAAGFPDGAINEKLNSIVCNEDHAQADNHTVLDIPSPKENSYHCISIEANYKIPSGI
jgi:hypothetical protein